MSRSALNCSPTANLSKCIIALFAVAMLHGCGPSKDLTQEKARASELSEQLQDRLSTGQTDR